MLNAIDKVIFSTFWSRRCKELAAFLTIEIAVHDPELYARYRQADSSNLAAASGTYLVRGGEVEVLEGNWRANRMVVVRFDSARKPADGGIVRTMAN